MLKDLVIAGGTPVASYPSFFLFFFKKGDESEQQQSDVMGIVLQLSVGKLNSGQRGSTSALCFGQSEVKTWLEEVEN